MVKEEANLIEKAAQAKTIGNREVGRHSGQTLQQILRKSWRGSKEIVKMLRRKHLGTEERFVESRRKTACRKPENY